MLIEQDKDHNQFTLTEKAAADSLKLKLYIYYNQHQWLAVSFGLTGEYVELWFMISLCNRLLLFSDTTSCTSE